MDFANSINIIGNVVYVNDTSSYFFFLIKFLIFPL
jgi:hypothetical protein